MARESMGEDFVHGGNLGYNWFYAYGDNTSWGYTYGLAAHFWNSYWPWVKACNDVLKTVKSTNGDPTYMGLAYAYRAFFYLDMVRLYEFKTNPYTSAPDVVGLSIPIVTEDTTEQMAANNPRATVDAVYELIFSDLENAEKYLKSYAPAPRPTCRIWLSFTVFTPVPTWSAARSRPTTMPRLPNTPARRSTLRAAPC